MQFYARFQDEVIAAPAVIAAHIARSREQVSDAFRHIFDVALVEAHQALIPAPADLAAKVRFITLYHLILEGTLGLTSFRFITDYLSREGLLPGFVEGYSKIHHDETRHIGYGVWWLRETVREDPEQADVMRQMLRGRGRPEAARRRRRLLRPRRHRGGTASVRARRPDAPPVDHRRPARNRLRPSS
jgi:ribonucleoside-diphosphate reductase beta chain